MNRADGRGGLNQGSPADQAGAQSKALDEGRQGSQSGGPQRQDAEQPANAATDSPRHAPTVRPEEARGLSETEREAGTPDPRATTDWNHGEGESPANKSSA